MTTTYATGAGPTMAADSALASRLGVGLALLRAVVGGVFLAHGTQKLFVFGLAAVTGMFGQMGIPLHGITAPLVALLEFFAGIALVAGLLTRLAALGLAIEMLGAILLVHLKGGFFLPNGFEFAFTLLGSCLVIALLGAGDYSLDHVLAGRSGRK